MGACLGGESKPVSPRLKSNSYGGDDALEEEKKEDTKKSSSSKVSLQKTKTCKSKKKLTFRPYCEPLLYKNKIIFLSGDLIRNKDAGMTLEAQYLSKYYMKDLESDTISEHKINCDDDTQIDILPSNSKCVYTLNPLNDKIYFIVNNSKLMTLDLTTNTLSSLNKEIDDMESSKQQKNLAQIAYLDGKGICVMGPDKITNNVDEEKDDDYVHKVPYNRFRVTQQGQDETSTEKCKFENYGEQSRVITAKMDNKNCILMMGGIKLQKAEDSNDLVEAPHDEIFITDGDNYLTFSNKKDDNSAIVYHTAYPIHSFGIINYKNEYIFQFGGIDTQRPKTAEDADKPGTRVRNDIRVLRISKGDPDKDNYELERYRWYSLEMKIPRNGPCHAIFASNNDKIELFTCFGKHYSFSPNELFDQLSKGKQKKDENSNDDRLTEGWKELNPWTEAGKTVNPTKSTSIRNIGPAPDSDVDEMLRLLHESGAGPYEDYINSMDEFSEYKEIYDDKNLDKLKAIIKNKEHLDTIIAKAKELCPPKAK